MEMIDTSLLKEAKSSGNNAQLFIKVFAQFDCAILSFCGDNYNSALDKEETLEVWLKIETETSNIFKILQDNGIVEHVVNASFAKLMNIHQHSFSLCRTAGQVSDSKPDNLTQILSTLFQMAYQNMKNIMEVVESFEKVSSGDVMFLQDLVLNFVKCSQVLFHIDIMASAGIWKSIKRIFISKREIIQSHLENFSCLLDVCSIVCNTLTAYFDILPMKDTVMNTKYQKIFRFFVAIELILLEDFKDVVSIDIVGKVYELIYLIQNICLLETRQNMDTEDYKTEYDSLFNTLLCINEPFIRHFIQLRFSSQVFKDYVFKVETVVNKELVEFHIIINVLHYLTETPQSVANWMTDHTFLNTFFTLVDRNSSALFASRKDNTNVGKCMTSVESSLYEISIGKLFSCVETLDATHFHDLEEVMLNNLLFGSKYCFYLSCDLWCFVAQQGKAELSLNYYVFLGKLLVHFFNSNCKEEIIDNISYLMQRIFCLLEDYQHDDLVQNFPVTIDNSIIWRCIPLSRLNVLDMDHISSALIEDFIAVLDEIKCDAFNRSTRYIVTAIQCVSNLLGHTGIFDARLNHCIHNFWVQVKNRGYHENASLIVVTMLELTLQILYYLEEMHLVEILSCVSDALMKCNDPSLKLQCTHLLINLKQMTFPPSVQQKCLTLLSHMNHYLITQEDWIIEDSSMKALQIFAQETPFAESIATFLPQAKKNDFSRYLQRKLCAAVPTHADVLQVISRHKIAVDMTTHPDKDKVPCDFPDTNNKQQNEVNSVLDTFEVLAEDLKKADLTREQSDRLSHIISILKGLS